MSTFGVEFVIGVPATMSDLEEKVDRFYASLSGNFCIVSTDLAFDPTKGSLSVLLGVEAPEGLDPESLVRGVATDAVEKALIESELSDAPDGGVLPSAQILEFV